MVCSLYYYSEIVSSHSIEGAKVSDFQPNAFWFRPLAGGRFRTDPSKKFNWTFSAPIFLADEIWPALLGMISLSSRGSTFSRMSFFPFGFLSPEALQVHFVSRERT